MTVRTGIGTERPARFDYTPNRNVARPEPMQLHLGTSLPVLLDVFPSLLGDFHMVAPEQALQPPYYQSPRLRVPYPDQWGRYLRISSLTAMADELGPYRPSLMFVLDLTAENLLALHRRAQTVCRVGLLGSMLLSPTYSDRGPRHNFGLPRAVRIYSVSWKKPFSPTNLPPHPRDYKLVYENTDLRGRWGWTNLDFEPVRATQLLIAFSNFPELPRDVDPVAAKYAENNSNGTPWHFRGLMIERLSVHQYENVVEDSDLAPYVPVTSWQSAYEPAPVVSNFWQARGVAPAVPTLHQSIYRELMPTKKKKDLALDLLPSALVGLPEQVQSDEAPNQLETTADGYVFRSCYSGDAVQGDSSITRFLVLETVEFNPPSLKGLRLKVLLGARPDQRYTPLPEGHITIFGCDDDDAATSSRVPREGWTPIAVVPFDFSAEDMDSLFNFLYGQEILFPSNQRFRYYKIELAFAAAVYTGPRRLELARVELLRSIQPEMSPRADELLRLDEVQIRLTGDSLVDDYEFVNGREIMDIRVQTSLRDRPFEDVVRLNSLLDVREKTNAQVIAAQRSTRAKVQYFVDNQETSAQESLSVSNQRMLTGTNDDVNDMQSHPLVVALPSSWDGISPDLRTRIQQAIGTVQANIKGVSTERNQNLTSVLDLIGLLEQAGIPAKDIVDFMTGVANMSWNDAVGVSAGMVIDAVQAGLDFATLGLYSDLMEWFEGDEPPSAVLDFANTAISPASLVKVLNGLSPGASAQDLRNLDARPAVSISGSVGAQFIAGGSFGVSAQLDSGKSTALSRGTQGQALHAVNVTGPSQRRSRHEEEIDRAEVYDWKGQEVKRAGYPTDIVIIRIPIGATLSPPSEPSGLPDTVRVRIDMLPPRVRAEVRFLGVRTPLDQVRP